MYWTLGSRPLCGRFLLWAGLKNIRTLKPFIRLSTRHGL